MNAGSEVVTVEVVLVGGPRELAGTRRVDPAVIADRKLKVRHGTGYEHFVCADGTDPGRAAGPVVFRWSDRTRVAE